MTQRFSTAARLAAVSVLALGVGVDGAGWSARAQQSGQTPLSIVYGPGALSREGDVDYREDYFISVPADMTDRLWLRVFDPDTGGAHDTPYRRPGDTETAFRLFGGAGAWSEAPRPVRAADGPLAPNGEAAPQSGALIAEARFGAGREHDDRWVTVTPFTAAQGEVIDGRAYFRFEAVTLTGDDGNAFSMEVAASAEGGAAPAGVRIFSYRPTLRWPGGREHLEVALDLPAGAPVALQSFDAANARIELVSTFGETALAASGQDDWVTAGFTAPEGPTVLTYAGGRETPNDATFAAFDARGGALAFELPARLASRPRRPEPVAQATPLADCISVAFDASRSRGAGDLRMLWLFGDGASATEPVIVHRYAQPGRYEAELRVIERAGGAGAGASARVPVHVRPAPAADAGAAITVAPGDSVAFDGGASAPSDEPIRRWLWSFGDGARAVGVTAEHVYAAPGLYSAALRVEDDAAHPCNFGVAQRPVRVNFPPVAEAGEGRSVAVGEGLRLSGAASYDVDGEIVAWDWDLGDGTSAEGPSVDHAYRAPGVYVAALRVRDDAGVANSAAGDDVTITVNAPPVPSFEPQPRPLAVGEVGVFDGSASTDPDGEILSYRWDFGDGSVGEGPVVDYAWRAPGVYNVTLETRDDSATRSDTARLTIPVTVSAAPVANAGPDQHVTASVVVFDGSGSSDADGAITAWEWTFGDGAGAVGEAVRHAYAEPGEYEARLLVRDDSGAPLNMSEDIALIRVNAAPIADAGPDHLAAPGQEVLFDGAGSVDPDGRVADWRWRFGDGNEARGPRVAHTYAESGLYRVELLVRDDTGHEAAFDVDEAMVRVNHPPVADAGPDILTLPGGDVVFDGRASHDPDGAVTAWRWDFSDAEEPLYGASVSRRFDAPGVVTARLTALDDSGALNGAATDEARVRVNAAPVADAGPEIATDQLVVTLDGGASFDPDGDRLTHRWDFGDGSAPFTGRVATHTFPRSGAFPVTLTVDDGSGLPNATSSDVTQVLIDARPVAVAGGGREVCSGDQVLFDASASHDPDGGLLRYGWDFGDGTRSEIVNPAKTYERPGVYPVTLTVRDESGFGRGVHSDRIAVVVREAPRARAAGPRRICTGQTVRFDGSASTDPDGSVDQYSWSFGDGTTAAGEQPQKIFERAGDYRVALTITGDGGALCKSVDTDEMDVVVVEAPRLTIDGPIRVAAGAGTLWRAALGGGAEASAFRWDMGDGVSGEGETVTHAFAEPGVYDIALEAALADESSPCATVATRVRVVVNAAPTAVLAGPDMAAVGAPVLFDASGSSDPDGGLVGFAWDFGDGATAEGVQVEHTFAAPGVHRVVLTVTDEAGVSNSAAQATKEVAVSAAPSAGFADPGPLCPGESRVWRAGLAEGGAATWRFGDGGEASGLAVSHAFAAPGVFAVTAALDDGLGQVNSRREETVLARVNSAPRAQAGPDRLLCPGDVAVFDATGSSDADGEIVAWRWAFDDGVTLDGPRVERAFDAPGTFAARLFVTDDSGSACAVGEAVAQVRVNAAPSVDAGPDRETFVGAAHDVVLFDAGDAHDPDGDGVQVVWDLGDGTVRASARVRHAYGGPGEYVATVIARDGTGLACGETRDTTRVRASARVAEQD